MLRVGIVGIGGMGNVHIKNIENIDFAKVVALCDPSPLAEEKAKEVGAPLYKDIEEMLDASALDAVCICTPTFMHYDHIKKVLSRGVNTITEKPLALKSSQARELFRYAEDNNAMIFVAHVIRFWKEYALLREIIRDERYGKVLDAEFWRLSACPQWVKGGWLFDKEKSGLIPFDLHIHDLDYIVSLFGRPAKWNVTKAGNKDKPYKEHYRFIYEYDDKSVVAQASWYNADIPFNAGFRVYFENALIEYSGEKMTAYSFDFEPLELNPSDDMRVETGINVPATGAYYNELLHFLTCVQEKRKSELFTNQELIDVLEILEAISSEDQE